MADIKSAESLRSPLRYFNPRAQGGIAYTPGATAPHYLDGAFSVEIEGIRVLDPEFTNGGGFSSDNNDPVDLPAASGSKKRLVGTSGVAGFVNADAGGNTGHGVVRYQTGTVASAALGFRAYPDTAGSVATDTGPPVAYVPGKRLWYTTRVMIPSAGSSTLAGGTMACGLGNQSSLSAVTTSLAAVPTVGLYFQKAAANATVDFYAGSTKLLTDVHTLAGAPALALDTFFEYSVQVDAVGNVIVYVNGRIASIIALGTAGLPSASQYLTEFVGRDNVGGTSVAQKVDQDYYLCVYEV